MDVLISLAVFVAGVAGAAGVTWVTFFLIERAEQRARLSRLIMLPIFLRASAQIMVDAEKRYADAMAKRDAQALDAVPDSVQRILSQDIEVEIERRNLDAAALKASVPGLQKWEQAVDDYLQARERLREHSPGAPLQQP